MKIAVIGSGIGGLAVAIRMAAKGHDVTVYEKNALPGGKLAQIHIDGFRFDTGPSLFTLPNLIDELFELCGERREDFLSYSMLENNCKYFYPDGTVFNFYHDKKKLREEIEAVSTENPENIMKRLREAEEMYAISAPVFLFSSFRKFTNYFTKAYRKVFLKAGKLDVFRTMHVANVARFTDARFVQLFDRYATYNGSSPYVAPATLNMIAHLENNIGAFFPDKGMYAIVECLFQLAQRKVVRFEFNTLVEEIVVEKKAAKAIRVAGDLEHFELVISDSDVKHLVNSTLQHPLHKSINKLDPSSSALIFYWGINQKFPELELHNILFSNDYAAEFDAIFTKKSICDDPTVYLFISSKHVKEDAPKDSENWFVMINVPSNSGQDWEMLIAQARNNIITKINMHFKVNIEKHIVAERVASPLTIEANTLSQNGALYGSSSNSMFAAFLRHPNWLSNIGNLYFVGGSVHPGGGIPLCLASAKIVSNEIPSSHEYKQ